MTEEKPIYCLANKQVIEDHEQRIKDLEEHGPGPGGHEYTGLRPIAVDNDNYTIGISVGRGLVVDDETGMLRLNVTDPMKVSSGQLGINLGRWMNTDLSTGKLSVAPGTGDGIIMDYEDDKLKLQNHDPIKVDRQGIGLKIGTGLGLDSEGNLQVTSATGLTFTAPLHEDTETGEVTLNYGNGLSVGLTGELYVPKCQSLNVEDDLNKPATGYLVKSVKDGLEASKQDKLYVDDLAGLVLSDRSGGGQNIRVDVGPLESGSMKFVRSSVIYNGFIETRALIDAKQSKLTAGSRIALDERTATIDAKDQITAVRVKVIGTGASGQPPTQNIGANASLQLDITDYVQGAIPSGYTMVGQGAMFCTSLSHDAVIPSYFFYYNSKYWAKLLNTSSAAITLNNMWVEILVKLA